MTVLLLAVLQSYNYISDESLGTNKSSSLPSPHPEPHIYCADTPLHSSQESDFLIYENPVPRTYGADTPYTVLRNPNSSRMSSKMKRTQSLKLRKSTATVSSLNFFAEGTPLTTIS